MKAVLVLAFLYGSLAWAKAQVRVRAVTTLKSSQEISFADVAEFKDASPSLKKRIGKILLASAPGAGEQVSFSSLAISELIRTQLTAKERSQIRLTLPPKIVVKVASHDWSEDQVKKDLLSKWGQMCSGCRLNIDDLMLPSGTFQNWALHPGNGLPKGPFNVRVDVTKNGKSATLWVRGHLTIERYVPVAKRALFIGDHLSTADVAWRWKDVTMAFDGVPGKDEIVDDKVRISIPAGDILWSRNLQKVKALHRGDLARVYSSHGNWEVSVTAISQQDGAVGDTVTLKTPNTHKLISGIVTAQGEVRIP